MEHSRTLITLAAQSSGKRYSDVVNSKCLLVVLILDKLDHNFLLWLNLEHLQR